MKKTMLIGLVLGLLTGVGVAQRGRGAGAVSPTARPDVNLGAIRSAGVSPTMGPNRTTVNRNVDPTLAPVKDPKVASSNTVAPNGTTVNRNVEPTPVPIRDPLVGDSATAGANTTLNRNVSPTAAEPIRDPK
jgi:hypothetical protein